jgi:hypothetical protein
MFHNICVRATQRSPDARPRTFLITCARRCADMTAASGMASSALEQHPIPLDGNVCCRAARDFCVAWLTGSRIFPFRRSGLFCVLERAGSAAAAAGRLLAAPGAARAARHGGPLLEPLVLGPHPLQLDLRGSPSTAQVWCRRACLCSRQPFGAVLYLQGRARDRVCKLWFSIIRPGPGFRNNVLLGGKKSHEKSALWTRRLKSKKGKFIFGRPGTAHLRGASSVVCVTTLCSQKDERISRSPQPHHTDASRTQHTCVRAQTVHLQRQDNRTAPHRPTVPGSRASWAARAAPCPARPHAPTARACPPPWQRRRVLLQNGGPRREERVGRPRRDRRRRRPPPRPSRARAPPRPSRRAVPVA